MNTIDKKAIDLILVLFEDSPFMKGIEKGIFNIPELWTDILEAINTKDIKIKIEDFESFIINNEIELLKQLKQFFRDYIVKNLTK